MDARAFVVYQLGQLDQSFCMTGKDRMRMARLQSIALEDQKSRLNASPSLLVELIDLYETRLSD